MAAVAPAAAPAPAPALAPAPVAPPELGSVEVQKTPSTSGATVTITATFDDLTSEKLLANFWPAGTQVYSESFRALGVWWRLVVWPNFGGLNRVRYALELTEPKRTITPESVITSSSLHPQTEAHHGSITFSTVAAKPGAYTQIYHDTRFERLRPAGPIKARKKLTVSVQLKAAKASAHAMKPVSEGSTLKAQLRAVSETMDGADVNVALYDASEAAAAVTPLKAHSFVLLLRCGARAALGAMAARGPRRSPFTLTAPQGDGAAAMKAFLAFLYSDKLPPSPSHAMLCELLIAANYFDVPMLLMLCEQPLVAGLSPSNMLITLRLAEQHSRQLLLSQALRHVAAHLNNDVTLSLEWAALPLELSSAVIHTALNDGEPPERISSSRTASRPREEDGAAEAGGTSKRPRDGSN